MMFVLFLALSVIKLVISATFMVLYPYTAEIYETMLRGKALGIFSACGRVSTMFVGVVGVYAMEWFNGNGLYVIFVLLSGVAGIGAKTMPYCTSGRSIS
jgi:nitrate/nitrite transporter NarK